MPAREECDGSCTEVVYAWQECSKGYVNCLYCAYESKLSETALRRGAGIVRIRRHKPKKKHDGGSL